MFIIYSVRNIYLRISTENTGCSENKEADQIRSYTAIYTVCFRIMQNADYLMPRLIFMSKERNGRTKAYAFLDLDGGMTGVG